MDSKDLAEMYAVEYIEDGDPFVLGLLAVECQRLARAVAFKMQRRHEPVDDLAQIALVALLENAHRYDPGRGVLFRTFIAQYMRREIGHYYRRTWRNGIVAEPLDEGHDPPATESPDALAAAELLDRLAPLPRRVMHLRLVEELTQAEVADVIGVSQRTVSRVECAALDRLRRLAS